MLEQELAIDDAEERKEEDQDGQLERDAEAEDDGEEEAGVVLNGEDGVEGFAELQHQDFDRTRQHVAVAEPCA